MFTILIKKKNYLKPDFFPFFFLKHLDIHVEKNPV